MLSADPVNVFSTVLLKCQVVVICGLGNGIGFRLNEFSLFYSW